LHFFATSALMALALAPEGGKAATAKRRTKVPAIILLLVRTARLRITSTRHPIIGVGVSKVWLQNSRPRDRPALEEMSPATIT
jgi:hypothetical protein